MLNILGRKEGVPNLLLLVGLPASGKSTFAKNLVNSKKLVWKCLNQDTIGDRQGVERALRKSIETTTHERVIIDRCNPRAKERNKWIQMAGYPQHAAIVHFCIDKQTCIERAKLRKHHPTVPPEKASMVVGMFVKDMEEPNLVVDKVHTIYQVYSIADCQKLIEHFESHEI
jgi:tRNA uridine 5-carbamoylmethylation protein Kti12